MTSGAAQGTFAVPSGSVLVPWWPRECHATHGVETHARAHTHTHTHTPEQCHLPGFGSVPRPHKMEPLGRSG